MIAHRRDCQRDIAERASNLQDLGQRFYHLKEIRENRTKQKVVLLIPMTEKEK